jgi:hypothetical protein
LNAEEHLADVNNITGVLKLWFRELPDPLFTREMYHDFINASSELFIPCHLYKYSKNMTLNSNYYFLRNY